MILDYQHSRPAAPHSVLLSDAVLGPCSYIAMGAGLVLAIGAYNLFEGTILSAIVAVAAIVHVLLSARVTRLILRRPMRLPLEGILPFATIWLIGCGLIWIDRAPEFLRTFLYYCLTAVAWIANVLLWWRYVERRLLASVAVIALSWAGMLAISVLCLVGWVLFVLHQIT